jgi:hypothetical protein
MISKLIRWRLLRGDVDRLPSKLRPVRTQEEVARMMDCSPALIAQLERSALRKIMQAMAALEDDSHGKLPEPGQALA